jgi:two-component system, NarL family, sensor kinase
MKRWPLIIWIILFASVFDLASPLTARAVPPATNQNKASLKDSLLILDTLVKMHKVSNSYLAVHWAKRALVIANLINTPEAEAHALTLLGIGYSLNHKDSSFFYFNAALDIAEAENLANQRVHILYSLAMISKDANDYKTSLRLLDSTVRMAESIKNYEVASNAYVAIGNIRYGMNDYESARNMYESAFKVAAIDSLYFQMGVANANLAKKVFEKNNVLAIVILKKALGYLRKINNGKGAEDEIANILINIGNKNTNPDSALFYYKSALNLAVNVNLPKIIMGAYNSMAYRYLKKGNTLKAESCLKDFAIPVGIKNKDNDWLSSLHDTYADVAIAQGDYKKAFEMQKNALSYRIADNNEKASDQIRLLASVLDLKNKELIIQTGKTRLQRVKFWLVIALLLVFVSIFTILVLYQRNKVKLQKEQIGSARRIIEMEESEKGRIARELHDLTGQLVMGISGTIENIEFPEPEIKEQIKNSIKDLGSSIRQISHRMNRAMIEHFTFSELITGLCEDVQKLSRMSVHLEIPEEFPGLPNELVLHFYRITQELLTNATKYARESQVRIKIVVENGKLALYYSDNGPGFIVGDKGKPSMGIMNIYERAKLIGGQATLKSSPGKGTSWEILFPILQKNNVKS